MVVSKSLYKSTALRRGDSVARMMREANAEISRDNSEDLFVTVFAGLTMVSNLKFYSFKAINLRKSVPFVATSGIENWFSSHALDSSGPVVWKVQLGCVTAIERGLVHVRPPSSDQLMKMSDETNEPCSPFWNSVVVT